MADREQTTRTSPNGWPTFELEVMFRFGKVQKTCDLILAEIRAKRELAAPLPKPSGLIDRLRRLLEHFDWILPVLKKLPWGWLIALLSALVRSVHMF